MSFFRALNRAYYTSCGRYYTTGTGEDLRQRLMSEIKAAMKNRDTSTSTTLRSVMSDINSAEKASKEGLSSSAMATIVRKAIQRRAEAVAKFNEADRPELAEKEQKEADLLSGFLPPLLSTADIDTQLKAVISKLPYGSDPKRSLGIIFKEFYLKVDKSTVDANLVKERAQGLISE